MPTRVLVVEDSRTQAEALRELLAGAGYDVTLARNGEEGLERFAATKPEIVISDVVMPGSVDGYELCRRVKTQERGTPVMLLTGLTDPMDIIRGLESGADNFLTKPYEATQLLERLQLLIANRRARAQDRVKTGIKVVFMGREFTISAEREQILDLLITTFEEAVRQNRQLRRREDELTAAQAQLTRYAQSLEARLERILASVPDVLFSITGDRKSLLYVSPAAAQVFGRAPDQMSMDYWRAHIHPLDRPLVEDALVRAANTRRHQAIEYRFQRGPRDERRIASDLTAVTEGDGKARIDGIARDITERRALEEQLRQAQKMEALGRLAGGVAHDFNNILATMFMELDLALADTPPDHPLVETLQQLRRAAERATSLSRQLLTFSRRQVVEPTSFDLNELLKESERMLRRLIGEDVELITTLAPGLGTLHADRGQVEQVLMNLVVNARDAMPHGGKLMIETSNAILDSDYAAEHRDVSPGPYVCLSVTDTGTGMTPEVQARLFEPFFTTKEEGKGTGLGLATSYGIVRQAGGHIGVYSEPGHGTTFRVYLPRVDAPRVSAAPRAPISSVRGTETVLLVEDSASLRAGTRRILTAHGYRVIEAPNGPEALRQLADNPGPVHLLLTDVVLPGMPGYDLARRVREQRPELRVLFVSGYTDDLATHQRLIEEGAAFLQKPYTQDSLTRKVREVLESAPGPSG